MRRARLLFLLSLALPGALAAETEFVGRLDPEPVPEPRQGTALGLFEGPQAGLPAPLSPGDRTFGGKIFLRETEPSRARVVLVEPASGPAFVYADLNQDDLLSAEERFELKREPDGEWESVTLRFPLKVGAVKEALVYLGRSLPEKEPDKNARRLAYNVGQAVGTVQVDTRQVRVRYRIDLDTGQVDIASSQAMDLDGSGTFDRGLSRGEVETGDGVEPVVFHVSDYYLSARSVDLASGRIVLRTHPASDYRRIELAPGSIVPDFEFTGPDGKPRRLSDLRGKVVLLDFWGTWCGPCLQDVPKLRKIHEAYRGQGFEILGLPFEDDLETLKKFLAENDLPWVHATASSVADLVRNRFRVFSFPTKILLDREGQVVRVGEAGQPALKTEDDLRKAVEEVLARPRAVEYEGRLEPGLAVEPRWGSVMGLEEVKQAELPAPPSPGDRMFEARLWLRRSTPPSRVVLVEPAAGSPFLYADVDLDGRLSAQERFGLVREPDGGWESVALRFALKAGVVDGVPVTVGRTLPEKDPAGSFRRLAYSVGQAVGTVKVGSREVRVRYWVDLETGQASLAGGQAMDLDGNGTFDRGLSRGEVEVPIDRSGIVIFRLGDLYLSTRSVDLATGRVVLRTHPASDYRRFELAAGSQIPDFDFNDVDGKPRRLSELRGKVVLLDFWGTWCGPCVADMPRLRKVHEAYRGRGFEIVSLDFEEDLDTQRKFLAENDLPWTHATAASVADLVRSRFRVSSFPTKILLDREGRIVSVGDPGQLPLKTEDDVRQAVEEVLSRPVQAGAATSSR